jgi:ubiquinone/menaquinone biosynthesis C-methylase UbiE
VQQPELDDRYEREREFHNQENERWEKVEKFYELAAGSRNRYKDVVLAAPGGTRVLEYGCGTGGYAFDLATLGASVTGIDISDVRIEKAKERAEGLDGLTFEVMNAEQLAFSDDTFDLICGSAILHHLRLEQALAEIARTLKEDGRAVFLEPLGHNPVINLYRNLTPGYRTPDEHPLLMRDLRLAGQYFARLEVEYFHLMVLLASPFARRRGGSGLASALDRIDRAVIRGLPFVRRYAWMVVLSLTEPKRAPSPYIESSRRSLHDAA